MNSVLLNRREAILRVAQLAGLSLIGGPALLRGEAAIATSAARGFTSADLALMDEIGETIIPATDTPGAKAIGIGAFMAMMVDDCYDAVQQAEFRAGLRSVDAVAQQRFGRKFVECAADQRTALLDEIDAGTHAPGSEKPRAGAPYYFVMLKQLAIVGYFTSEAGCRGAFIYEEVPGRYEGDALLGPGEKADYKMPSGSLK